MTFETREHLTAKLSQVIRRFWPFNSFTMLQQVWTEAKRGQRVCRSLQSQKSGVGLQARKGLAFLLNTFTVAAHSIYIYIFSFSLLLACTVTIAYTHLGISKPSHYLFFLLKTFHSASPKVCILQLSPGREVFVQTSHWFPMEVRGVFAW